MNQKSIVRLGNQDNPPSPRLDTLKWTFVVLLFLGGIVANTYFAQVVWALRAAAGLVVIVVALLIASQTAAGQLAWLFAKGSRQELRKVVWPTRQETVQTTLIVVAMVVFSALILWGVDTVIFWVVAWLTGQRG